MKPSGNTWKLASRSFAAVAMAAALAACGGGDDDNDVAPPPGGTMTQADAETWSRTAASGFALVNVAQTLMQLDLRDYTSSQLPAGQQRTTSNCPSGGTITVDYRKTAGGAVGDYIQLDYDNCRNADTEQDGMRRLAVVAANRDAVRFEERFRDYSFRAQGAIDVEIDDGVLAVSVGDAGRVG